MEFAFVAPVFITLLFGILEMGRMVMVQNVMTSGAREGARRAVVEGATTSSVTSAVTSYLSGSSVRGATVTVSPDPSTASYGDSISVTVQVPFRNVSWLPAPFFLGATTLSATTTMRSEILP